LEEEKNFFFFFSSTTHERERQTKSFLLCASIDGTNLPEARRRSLGVIVIALSLLPKERERERRENVRSFLRK
jgi:hypothetical protein